MSISMEVHDQADREVSPATFTFFIFACLAVYLLLKTIQNFGVAGLRGILLFFVQCYLSHSTTHFRLDQSLVSNPCEEGSDSGLHKENELTFCLLLRFLNFNYYILFWLLERWSGSPLHTHQDARFWFHSSDGSSSIIAWRLCTKQHLSSCKLFDRGPCFRLSCLWLRSCYVLGYWYLVRFGLSRFTKLNFIRFVCHSVGSDD